jgi:hypothetical protein
VVLDLTTVEDTIEEKDKSMTAKSIEVGAVRAAKM